MHHYYITEKNDTMPLIGLPGDRRYDIAMKRLLLVLIPTMTIFSETITDAERERAVRYLDSTREKVLASVHGLSEAQWKWKPAPERWSVAECVEHITATEQLLFERLQAALKEPAQPEKKALVKGKENLIMKAVPSRERRVTAPEEVRPTGRWPAPEGVLRAFNETRGRTLEFARETQTDLRSYFYPHFILGDFDAYQWLLFMGAHFERHNAQIEEVKATAGFPSR